MAIKIVLFVITCVIFNFDFGHGIADRTRVEITKHAYQVTIEYDHMYRCSGAILNENWVITAAQCLLGDLDMAKLIVRAGTKIRGVNGKPVEVAQVILHPEYDQENFDNDIGLVQVAMAFVFNTTITSAVGGISVATKIPLDGTYVTLSGWGSPSPGTWLSHELLESSIPLVYWMDCAYNYKRVDRHVTENMFCAGEYHNGVCGGDTGDPLTYKDALIGIMSWDYGCNEQRFPAVFSAVYKYSDWINQTISYTY